MKIGINWGCFAGLSTTEQIRLMQKHGFDATFVYTDAHAPNPDLKQIRQAGITIDTIHAPFDHINDMWKSGLDGDAMLKRLLFCVEEAAEHDIPIVVCHTSSGPNPPIISDIGNARYKKLLETAHKYGITVAFENQRKLANLAIMFEYYDNARFCWDVGHEACFTPGKDYMQLFGEKLVCVHLQDNMKNQNEDLHLIPFDGKIDFDRVARILAAHNYKGTAMLEIHFQNSGAYNDISPEDYYRKAADAARQIANAVENYR